MSEDIEDTKRILKMVPKNVKPESDSFKDAIDLVERFLADIHSGEIKPMSMMVFYLEETDDGKGLRPRYWFYNTTPSEQIAYGALIQASALDEWKQ